MYREKTAGQKFTSASVKCLLALVASLILWLPTELFFWAYNTLKPGNFWEKLVTLGVGAFFGGTVQFFLFFVWIWAMLEIIDADM